MSSVPLQVPKLSFFIDNLSSSGTIYRDFFFGQVRALVLSMGGLLINDNSHSIIVISFLKLVLKVIGKIDLCINLRARREVYVLVMLTGYIDN